MQAAGGASLDATAGIAGAESEPPRAARRRARILFAVVALVAYAADVVTKVLAVEHLTGRDDVPLVGSLLQLNLVRNPGAAFSTGTGFTAGLSLLAIAAVVVVLVLSRRLATPLWAAGLGLLLAGVAGNLTDRLVRAPGPLRGHVVDFLMLPNWPIFNLADVCINLAAAIILVQTFRGVRLDGRRAAEPSGSAEPPGPADSPEQTA
ncbi:signal peptidase II [Nocardioides sp. TRM66260-LWL]|uniref:signal peptidase II n=1 Tax=Nocardioides sp. TRM66260-LWL TaxID=2874478 RepID=UPI001CC67385|nr:signal peptidase II [Nocardioides sp. TRM66260-LWL]MBZ5733358.1 signal peptidase II [Nocardioides sp. TRM66260-LWL]